LSKRRRGISTSHSSGTSQRGRRCRPSLVRW
jgi:hypothetical protein